MKKIISLCAVLMLLSIAAITKAQTPQAIKYQAIARNASGEAIANQNVSFRISILQGSAEGAAVYQEVQTTTTNQYGLANLSIGMGNTTTGLFDSIKWGNATYFAKIEFDPKGGTEYTLMGTSQLLSVPYSLYAEHAKVADNLPVFPIKASLQATNVQAPFDAPETGMLVYNTDSAGTSPNNVVPGYYYNAGTTTIPNWVLLTGTDVALNTRRAFATGTGVTTYGGLSQDGNVNHNAFAGVANTIANPLGDNNTGFGSLVFGNNASTNPSGTDNTGVGYEAMGSITSGTENIAVGSEALSSNQTGSYCTAIGFEALSSNKANYNTACGYATLVDNVSGVNNSAFGVNAMAMNTSNNNSAIGTNAMFTNNSGSGNNAIGYNALFSNSSGSANVADGVQAMYYNTASNNTAVGYSSLYNNTTGTNNTATGFEALQGTSGSSTGSSNTANGANALYSNSHGSYNTAVGDSALAANSLGAYNTAVGYQTLSINTTATNNTAIGYQALFKQSYNNASATYSTDNVAIGYQALFSNQPTSSTTGYQNNAIGDYALYSNTTGNWNTAIGYDALYTNSTGTTNTATGDFALRYNTTGAENVANGYGALNANTTGTGNIAIGQGALNTNTTGGSNTGVGLSALGNIVAGANNTALGYQAGPTGDFNNTISIGNTVSTSNSNQIAIGNSSNNFCGINGASYNSADALVLGTSGTNGGGAYCTIAGVWTNISDRNKKENISVIDEEDILKKINTLPVLKWNYKGEQKTVRHIGPMAQDFYRIFQVGNDSVSISTIDPAAVALVGVKALNKKLELENSDLKTSLTQIKEAQNNDEREIAELKKLVESLTSAQASIKK